MSFKDDREKSRHDMTTKADSEDSDEDTSHEEPPYTTWGELSIIDRVGLNSVEMSEKDLEATFSQIALAFRCDQFTLKQRLQAEEHARNLAEENIQLELSRGRETLEVLKALCLDSKRSTILQRLELSLDILGGTVERISNTAEVLGAVHQEARVSRAVELMVAHVERLRRRHDKNVAELEEMRKVTQQQQQQQPSSNRSSINPVTLPEPTRNEESNKMENSKQSILRRRISASVISCQSQEKRKKDFRKRTFPGKKLSSSCSSPSLILESSRVAKEDTRATDDRAVNRDPSVVSTSEPPPKPSSNPKPEVPPSERVTTKTTQTKSGALETLRFRHKARNAPSNKGRERKAASFHRQLSLGSYGSMCLQHPLVLRLSRCRWTRLCLNLLLLACFLMMTYCLWKLHDEDP